MTGKTRIGARALHFHARPAGRDVAVAAGERLGPLRRLPRHQRHQSVRESEIRGMCSRGRAPRDAARDGAVMTRGARFGSGPHRSLGILRPSMTRHTRREETRVALMIEAVLGGKHRNQGQQQRQGHTH